MMPRSVVLAGLLALAACGAEGAGPTPPPPPPAEPTGTFLLRDPRGIHYTLAAGSSSPTQVSRAPFPFTGNETSLLPGGGSMFGMGRDGPGFPRGLRRLSLANGELTTLWEFPDINSWVFSTRASPDGKVLALGVAGWVPGRITLMQMDLATREVEQLWINTDEAFSFGRFSWLPDRSGLVGQAWELDRFRMARFDMATRTMKMLSDWIPGGGVLPTMELSRDGQTIAYNAPDGELRFITLDGAPASGFPTHLRGIFPRFSPDGRLLAYSKRRDDGPGIVGVFIYRFSDGATWRLLPEGSPMNELLDWQ